MQQQLINSRPICKILLLVLAFSTVVTEVVQAQKLKTGSTVRIYTRDGKVLEGTLDTSKVVVKRPTASAILSRHFAAEPSLRETEQITAGIAAIQGADRVARDATVAELTEIGLPALTPVLNAFKDRDLRQPDPLYRLFSRLMPGYADTLDRTLDLTRLKNGEANRSREESQLLEIRLPDGSTVPWSSIRSMAMHQPIIEKTFELHSLVHSTQIEFLDTGVALRPNSRVEISAAGFVRLSFAIDSWASDPDGLKVPGPNYKTNLVDGFPFGALVGKVGVSGARFMVGSRLNKSGLSEGRLYLAVNDNGHWQNNIDSFRVKLKVSDAYDVGDPQ